MTAITKNFYNGQFDITKMTAFLTQMAVMKPKLPSVLSKMIVYFTEMNAKFRSVTYWLVYDKSPDSPLAV